jgi:hypothetical protein
MEYIDMAQNRDRWRVLFNPVIIFGRHKIRGISWLAKELLLSPNNCRREGGTFKKIYKIFSKAFGRHFIQYTLYDVAYMKCV